MKNEEPIVTCSNVDDYTIGVLEVGGEYHVEEAFNLETEKAHKDPKVTQQILKKYPNPYFYLKEFQQECSCRGERIYFWHGYFKTSKNEHITTTKEIYN